MKRESIPAALNSLRKIPVMVIEPSELGTRIVKALLQLNRINTTTNSEREELYRTMVEPYKDRIAEYANAAQRLPPKEVAEQYAEELAIDTNFSVAVRQLLAEDVPVDVHFSVEEFIAALNGKGTQLNGDDILALEPLFA